MAKEMADNLTEREGGKFSDRDMALVFSGVQELGRSIGRYSVAPTSDASLRLREAIAEADSDVAIARALSRNIEVVDPHFQNLNLGNDEDLKDATAVTIGKAEAAKEELPSKEKGKVNRFQRALSSKYARGAVIATLPVVAAACGPIIGTRAEEVPGEAQQNTLDIVRPPIEDPVVEVMSWEEVKGNIDNFLNRTPEMTFEAVEEERRLFRSADGDEILPIGFYEDRQPADSERFSVEIQGVLLGFTTPSKDQVVSYIGLENRSTHERIVVPFSTWPFVEGGSAFAYKESTYPPALETEDAILLRGDSQDLVSWLTPLLNHPLVLAFEVDRDLSEPTAPSQENEWASKVSGNAVRLFDWLEGNSVTPPTYNLGNPTAQDVIHNNFYILPYPQSNPDASVTAEPSPTPTTTPEPTTFPEGYLSPEKIQELDSSFVCNGESCVRDVYRSPNFLYFDFISSGVFQEINLTNPKTGEPLGRGMVLKAVSKDKNDRPFVVNILVQLETVDRPGYNYIYGGAWTLIVAGRQNMDFIGEKPLSTDEWRKFIPEGETYEIMLLKRRAPDSDRISSDPVTRDLYYLFYEDPDYLETLKTFYESNGEEVDENLILFISGSSESTPRIVTT